VVKGTNNMDKIIDGILTATYLVLFTFGSGYTLNKAYYWSRNAAFEKIATGLGSLEKSSSIMTGGKLDY
jgi:hypothetical protein